MREVPDSGVLNLAWRIPLCLATATAYKLATNPFFLAAVLILTGHWTLAALVLAAHTIGCIGALVTAKTHPSPLTGQMITAPVRASIFHLWGNDQDGLWVDWHIAKYPPKWRWLAPFMWTWWRNKYRNLPFVPSLAWLHKTDPDRFVVFDIWNWRGYRIELWWQGWRTELKASKGRWFLDIGPRLDQPTEWGAVSWAFRLFGRS